MAGLPRPESDRAQLSLLDAVARALVVICLIALIFATFRIFHGADTPFLAFSLIGAAVVQATEKPRGKEIAVTLVMAGILALAYTRSGGHFGDYVGASVVAAAAFAGLASTLVLGYKACLATESLAGFLTATFCPILLIFTNVGLAVAVRLSPKVFDLFLYRFDGLLGAQCSFLVGQWFLRLPFLFSLCFLVYASLPLIEVLVFLLYLRGYRMPANPLALFAVAGISGFVLYQICPATGPVHVFGSSFPHFPPRLVSLEPLGLPDIPRNAIPSLHSAWALLIWWNLRRCPRWVQYAAAWFVVFTLLATLGLGEHYLIDLVVAVPFAVSVQAACSRQWLRAAGALALTMFWVVYLRFGLAAFPPGPAQAWSAVLVTLAGSALLAGVRIPWSVTAPSRDALTAKLPSLSPD